MTDRMLIFGERHVRLVLAGYEAHHNGRRPHRAPGSGPPASRSTASRRAQPLICRAAIWCPGWEGNPG